MNISEKIEDIRRQPQHVRLRYVWLCVSLSMLLIVIIWIFSIASLFKQEKNTASSDSSGSVTDLKNQLQNTAQQAPSIQNYTGQQQLTVDDEGVTTYNQNSNDFQYPASNQAQQAQTPQSPAYAQQQ